jgi:hypothetical protein
MNSDFFKDFFAFMSEIWQHQPLIIVLLIGGLILSVLLFIDTHRHRKKDKDRHKPLH